MKSKAEFRHHGETKWKFTREESFIDVAQKFKREKNGKEIA